MFDSFLESPGMKLPDDLANTVQNLKQGKMQDEDDMLAQGSADEESKIPFRPEGRTRKVLCSSVSSRSISSTPNNQSWFFSHLDLTHNSVPNQIENIQKASNQANDPYIRVSITWKVSNFVYDHFFFLFFFFTDSSFFLFSKSFSVSWSDMDYYFSSFFAVDSTWFHLIVSIDLPISLRVTVFSFDFGLINDLIESDFSSFFSVHSTSFHLIVSIDLLISLRVNVFRSIFCLINDLIESDFVGCVIFVSLGLHRDGIRRDLCR